MTITDTSSLVSPRFIDGLMTQIENWADANNLCPARVSDVDPLIITVDTTHRRDLPYLQEIQRELESRQEGTTRCEDVSIYVGQTAWAQGRCELIIKVIP